MITEYPYNFHTHTTFCDGKEPPENFVREAVQQGFKVLGFSGHAPVPFDNEFTTPPDKLDDYCRTIRNLKEHYKDEIEIFLALEADYIPGITWDFGYFTDRCHLDYIIGSVHLVTSNEPDKYWMIDGILRKSYDEGLKECFGNDIRKAVTTYYDQIAEMVATQRPTIVGHFDKIKMWNQNRFFSEDEPWYMQSVADALKVIKNKGCIVEVNTRGLYRHYNAEPFPGTAILKEIHQMGIPITLNSDAHSPQELSGSFDEALDLLRNIGFDYLFVLHEGKWKKHSL
jgi:histidinol-phosphatase (PHP family)